LTDGAELFGEEDKKMPTTRRALRNIFSFSANSTAGGKIKKHESLKLPH
jgi:hypothetical protein